MSKTKLILTTGLAMFAMFFGSGNLVFPIKIGTLANDDVTLSIVGLLLTGVLVPFLGLFSMIIYQGEHKKYFGLLGKYAPFILTMLILSLLGPFGVVPRCIIVAYGGFSVLTPNIPFALFSGIFSFTVIIAIWQKNKFIPIIGKYLAPFKIAGIALIIIAAIIQSPDLVIDQSNINPLLLGLESGYQTMDLLAGLFFSATIVEYLSTICTNNTETRRISLAASTIGASLIAIIYIGFVLLGAYYKNSLLQIKPEQYLATIAHLTLGKYAAFILAITVFLACMTTAASLSRLFASFVQTDLTRKKLNWPISVLTTVTLSFLLSLTGFDTISRMLAMILTYIYPALITLAISSILHKYYGFKWVKECFWGSLIIALLYSFL